jgi:tyrosyl-tRNA synthetase
VFAEKYLPVLGYKKRAHLMNTMVGGLSGSKMSSSDPDSKIDLLDDAKTVENKLKKAFCEEVSTNSNRKGNIKENPILQFLKVVIMPILNLKHGTTSFTIKRPEKWGGNSVYSTFQEVETAFAGSKLHPGDLKRAVTEILNEIMEPIRETFVKDKDLAALVQKAYPSAKPKVVEDISRLDIRVGKVVEVELHPEASDRLVVSKIDLGEKDGPRTIVSGLVGHITIEELKNRLVLVVANLKPSNFKGGI